MIKDNITLKFISVFCLVSFCFVGAGGASETLSARHENQTRLLAVLQERLDRPASDRKPWADDPLFARNVTITFGDTGMKKLLRFLSAAVSSINFATFEGNVLQIGFGEMYPDDVVSRLLELKEDGELVALARAMPHARIIGVEWTEHAVKSGLKKLEEPKYGDVRSRVHLFTGDGRDLNQLWAGGRLFKIEDASIDLIFFSHILDLYKSAGREAAALDMIIREAKRVLKPTGLFVANVAGLPVQEKLLQYDMALVTSFAHDIGGHGPASIIYRKKPTQKYTLFFFSA